MKIRFISLTVTLMFFVSGLAHAGTVNLPRTGQTKCYDINGIEIPCAGTGQDGEIRAGVAWPEPRFTANGDGTMTDNLTGLMWTKDANLLGGYLNFYQVIDFCNNLDLGGYTDWRLPNVNELESLVNANEPNSATWLNTQGFTNVQASNYWSSTTYAYYQGFAWFVGMWYGGVAGDPKSHLYYVWPVRGGQDIPAPAKVWETGQTTSYYGGDDGDLERGVAWPVPRFSDHGNGTVTDNLTGLMWTKNANLPNGYRTWQEALDYVSGMNAGAYPNLGYTDWRLSNRKELHSLTDYSRYNPALPAGHPFTNVQADYYWSSTTNAPFPSSAGLISMWNGHMYANDKSSTYYYVWPVRAGQSGSSGNSDHFEFSAISSPQAVGAPFSVTITYKDAYGNLISYTGNISLYTNAGAVSPTTVYLTNGTWTGNVTLYDAGCGIYLGASGNGISGVSNTFAITGEGAGVGTLQGTVKDDQGNALNNATVYISQTSPKNGGVASDSRTTTNGQYSFIDIACCNYFVWASYDGHESQVMQLTVPCNRVATADLTISMGTNTDARYPVLLVPGIMGSNWKYNYFYFPTLPPWSPDWDSGQLIIHDVAGVAGQTTGWRNLKKDLIDNHGYKENCTIFDVPYDWRLRNADAAKKYLKPWIDEAKRKAGAGTNKVNIVAHSQGGLVARAYIQGDDYANDVNKLAIVGTPNHGSPNAYYLWEGGDPISADSATGGVVYTLALNYLMYGPNGLLRSPVSDPFFYLKNYRYIHDFIPSVKQLLPTYNFISEDSLECEANSWLDNLNKDGDLSQLFGEENDETRIKTKIFKGDNVETINNIKVGLKSCSLPYYPDGTPLGWGPLVYIPGLVQKEPNGDGTVRTSSVDLDVPVSYGDNKTGSHSELINKFKDDLITFLTAGEPAAANRQTRKSGGSESPASSLSLLIKGRVQPYITAPSAQESGIKNDSLINTIPNTTVSIGAEAGVSR